jgi:hypothetical protein
MTQDEIIEIASQVYGECVWHESALLRLEAFVKLVEDKGFKDGYEKGIAAFNEAVELEREACAKVCDSFQARDVGMQPAECAGAIRARGKA